MAPNQNGEKRLAELGKSPDGYSSATSVAFDDGSNSGGGSNHTKANIWKNLLLICFAFLCNFISFGGVSNLQSSLNYTGGLGTGSLAVIYAALILSAMFVPSIVIKKIGCKWSICFSIVGYAFYALANFYPSWLTLIPASIFVGVSAAPLWAAKCTYVTTIATRYAKLTNDDPDAVVNRFFGIFFLFFQMNSIFGSLISSFVLSSADTKSIHFPTCFNESYIERYCGAADQLENIKEARMFYNTSSCPVSKLEGGKVPQETLYVLMGIYAFVGLLGAAIVGLLVDNMETDDEKESNQQSRPTDLLVATFKHMSDRRQILLIPITVYSGFAQAFFWSDYTRSFVTCPLAVNWVGFVLICFGAFDSFFSFAFGRLEKFTGRISLFSLATVINVILCFVMLTWTPYPSHPFPFFAIAAGWGVADAVWQTQLNALYGILFSNNKEAAFSNYRLWESIGFLIAFAYQNYVNLRTKLIVLLCLAPAGMILYFVVEYLERGKPDAKASPPRKSAYELTKSQPPPAAVDFLRSQQPEEEEEELVESDMEIDSSSKHQLVSHI